MLQSSCLKPVRVGDAIRRYEIIAFLTYPFNLTPE
jgi:hypothetical protein